MSFQNDKYSDLPELFPKRDDLKKIKKRWDGEDVYIIGGGPGFECIDPEKLKDKNVIGCNDAYLLGSDIVDVCYFLDESWWEKFKYSGNTFGGDFVTLNRNILDTRVTIHDSVRRGCYTGKEHKVASNANTGLSAINLAYKYGASRILLLGMNMDHEVDGRHHWHDENDRPPTEGLMRNRRGLAYQIFEDLFDTGVVVFNATPESRLVMFPVITPEELGVAK